MRGGTRIGAGRPKPITPTKMRSMRLTDSEYQQIQLYIKKLRATKQ